MDEKGFNARQTNRSRYPSIFNCFPVIKPVISKVRHFSTFFAHFGLPWVRLWDNRGKCYTDACQTHSSIYPSIFNRLRAIATTPPLGCSCSHWNSGKRLDLRKLNHGATTTRQWRQFDDRLSLFDTITACDGQTDRQTEGRTDRQMSSL